MVQITNYLRLGLALKAKPKVGDAFTSLLYLLKV